MAFNLDTRQFRFLLEEFRQESEETRAVLRAQYEARRRCVAHRKDGQRCRAWATWNTSEQLCSVHLYPTRRKSGEITDEIRKEQRRRRAPTCNCLAYAWPHRAGKGLCRAPDEPTQTWPTPAGKRKAGKLRRRKIRGIRRKIGI